MPHWTKNDNQITKNFSFKNFNEAVDFVNKVAQLAEKANHHPDIFLYNYKNVRLSLTTHAAGKVTEKDYDLASKIDEI
jgi:4a-hydroxytetrahydrobiopterin dehydratase